jgi:flagellar biogenesis protein FliO
MSRSSLFARQHRTLIGLIVLGSSLFLTPNVYGEEPRDTSPSTPSSDITPLGIGIPSAKGPFDSTIPLTSQAKAVAFFIVLLGGYGMWIRKRGYSSPGQSQAELQVTTRIMLTPRTSLCLIKVRDQTVLCAVGPEQVSIVPTDPRPAVPFHEILRANELESNNSEGTHPGDAIL